MNTSKILTSLALGSLTIIGCQKKQMLSPLDGNIGGKSVTNAFHANIYVDAAATSPFDGSTSHPFKTINDAVAVTVPGDVVNIRPGTYYRTGTGDYVVSIDSTHQGTASSPITYQATDLNNKPKIIALASDNIFKAIVVDANHIILNGLEVIGHKDSVVSSVDNGVAKYNTSGIQLSGIYDMVGSNKVFHQRFDITVKNCKVHDCPGGGIATKNAGQVTITGNECYNNSWYSQYANSGISILIPNNLGVASDGSTNGDSTHPKNSITNNLCYNNQCVVPNINSGRSPNIITDGNGIIVDVNRAATTNGNPNGDFLGYTRVENNISYNNGGAGINVTRAQNVTIDNNTTCNNGYKVGYAEIQLDNNCKNLSATNNILYARPSNATPFPGLCYNGFSTTNGNGKIIFDFNLYYPGSTATVVPGTYNVPGSILATTTTTQSIAANPLFAGSTPTTFGQVVPVTNFKLLNTPTVSPAINSGVNFKQYYSYFDYAGTYRAATPDRGAYEYPN